MSPLSVVLFAAAIAHAQPGTISAYAGAFPEALGGPATQATFRGGAGHMAQDGADNIYIVALAAVYRLSPSGILSLIAGTGVRGSTGDGCPASLARLNCGFFSGIVVDPQGNLAFAETLGHRVRPISADGAIVYATGLGSVDLVVTDGAAAPSGPFAQALNAIAATVQGKKAEVKFAGLAPGFAGVYQINVQIPPDVTADSAAPLIVTAGQQASPPVTLAVTRAQ